MSNVHCQRVSRWTGFNFKLRSGIAIEDNIAYLPTVNAPATDLGTVYEVLLRSLKIIQALDLNAIVCVFDKACEVVWKNPDNFHPIVLRMGVFHTICTMLAVIGKRFVDAGLRDISVESGVIADGSIAGVLDSKKYNRAIRLHKFVYEALLEWVRSVVWTIQMCISTSCREAFWYRLVHQTPLARYHVYQTIEETINKDTQTAGGTKGFSLKSCAVIRYYQNAEHRNLFLRQLREMVGFGGSRLNHPDLQQSRLLKDEADVQSLVNLMEDSWINPFRSDQDSLVSLATAAIPPMEIAHDLMNASKVGEEAFEPFRTRRLENNTVDFFATMKKQKLKTFSDVYTKKVTCKGKEIVLKALWTYHCCCPTRKLEMKKVVSYPLGPIPWALANADGSLRKTDKAKFMNDIAQNVPVVEVFTEKSACIVDGMSIVQKLDGNQKTFGDIAKTVLKIVIHEGDKCDRVDVVFDVYREGSIKDAERVNRGSGSGVKFRSLATGHKVKQWRSFLSEAQNKTMLIEFITEEWKSNESKSMIGHKTLFVKCGQKCWHIGQMGAALVNDLKSSQEEADTRILLHASNQGYTSVIVVSEDTDVFVLLIAFAKEIPASLYQKRGTSTRVRYMDIRKLMAVWGDKLSQALNAFHAFTGSLKQLKKDEVAIDAFVQLGTSWNVDQSLTSKLQEFTCRCFFKNMQSEHSPT